jgi:hypothetical protein
VGISYAAPQLAAFQEGFSSMKLVLIIIYLTTSLSQLVQCRMFAFYENEFGRILPSSSSFSKRPLS